MLLPISLLSSLMLISKIFQDFPFEPIISQLFPAFYFLLVLQISKMIEDFPFQSIASQLLPSFYFHLHYSKIIYYLDLNSSSKHQIMHEYFSWYRLYRQHSSLPIFFFLPQDFGYLLATLIFICLIELQNHHTNYSLLEVLNLHHQTKLIFSHSFASVELVIFLN